MKLGPLASPDDGLRVRITRGELPNRCTDGPRPRTGSPPGGESIVQAGLVGCRPHRAGENGVTLDVGEFNPYGVERVLA